MPEEFLTKQEIAKELKTSTRNIDYMIADGTAPQSFKIGKLRRFTRSGFNSWLESKIAPAE
jgi:excisionase family DNA binding protein